MPLLPHLQIWECPDPCTRPVGNALIRSEICRFVPVSTVPRACRFYLLLTGEVPRRGGGRETSGSFCWKIFGYSRFSNLARWPRSHAKYSKARPISPSAAPPQLPRQEELRPDRTRNAPENSAFCRPLLPERAWSVRHMARRNGSGASNAVSPYRRNA